MLRRLVPITILAGISLAVAACGGGTEAEPTARPTSPPPLSTAPVTTPTNTPAPTATPASPTSGKVVRVINHDLAGSGEYAFEPNDLTFSLGETVTIEVLAETELHSFTVDDLDIDIDVDGATTPGAVGAFTHTFDKAGTFTLICIYHEGNGMVGTVTVQ